MSPFSPFKKISSKTTVNYSIAWGLGKRPWWQITRLPSRAEVSFIPIYSFDTKENDQTIYSLFQDKSFMRSNPQTAQFTYLKYTMQGVLIYSCQWATITKTNFYNDYHYRYYVTSGHFHPPPPPPVPYPLAVTPLPSGPLSPSEAEETTNLFSVPIVLPSLDISPK